MLIRGTTPTITYKFTEVDVNNIAVAYLSIRQLGETLIEKDLSEAETGEDSLQWSLSQADTVLINAKHNVEIQCRYKTIDGQAYASEISQVNAYDIIKEGII